ncbi:MAG: hypothetical protein BWY41_02069 [Candidatus Atribacteria bacterium ADurb.Bin276]|uniref:Uncharacterized protein n=1 Tax=Candidatus Atribacter allofermentans TaxID=1852833 RepID=A0A1V5SJN3_9BACT|nr:MAG: hypothetical protein BWY41_02069 [Candidatus Atribacteria bacterium ADurb.Bin276]
MFWVISDDLELSGLGIIGFRMKRKANQTPGIAVRKKIPRQSTIWRSEPKIKNTPKIPTTPQNSKNP